MQTTERVVQVLEVATITYLAEPKLHTTTVDMKKK